MTATTTARTSPRPAPVSAPAGRVEVPRAEVAPRASARDQRHSPTISGAGVRHGHEINIRRTKAYAIGAFGLSLAGNISHVALTTPPTMAAELIAGKVGTAAVGPALIGAGLELLIRRPPKVVGDRHWPVFGQWRDFPVIGYVVVMVIGFALSFDHLRALAELVGVPWWAAWLLPVGIDLAAISVTFDHARSKSALEGMAAEQLEAAAAAKAEAERAAVEQAERDRQAKVEAERLAAEREAAELAAKAAADERAAAEAAAEAEAARTEAARIEAEAVEAEARRACIEARTASQGNTSGSEAGKPTRAASSPQRARGGPRRGDTNQAVADYLAEHPDATRAQVAAGVGCHEASVKRSAAWKAHRAEREQQRGDSE